MATRLPLSVRRCLRGLAESVKAEAVFDAGAPEGVEGRELVAWEEERRFGAIVARAGLEKLQQLRQAGLA